MLVATEEKVETGASSGRRTREEYWKGVEQYSCVSVVEVSHGGLTLNYHKPEE